MFDQKLVQSHKKFTVRGRARRNPVTNPSQSCLWISKTSEKLQKLQKQISTESSVSVLPRKFYSFLEPAPPAELVPVKAGNSGMMTSPPERALSDNSLYEMLQVSY